MEEPGKSSRPLLRWTRRLLRWAGALYLCWLAYDSWREARRPVEVAPVDRSRLVHFRRGFVTNFLGHGSGFDDVGEQDRSNSRVAIIGRSARKQDCAGLIRLARSHEELRHFRFDLDALGCLHLPVLGALVWPVVQARGEGPLADLHALPWQGLSRGRGKVRRALRGMARW